MKYEYWKSDMTKNATWLWHLKDNGQVIAQGDGYANKLDVLRAIDLAKLSRPTDINVKQSRRYRFSFAALLAFAVGVGLLAGAVDTILPRLDSSFIITDATVLQSGTYIRKNHFSPSRVKFSLPDGRDVVANLEYIAIVKKGTTVRIRYNPRDPEEVIWDSDGSQYFGMLTFLMFSLSFFYAAYFASLHFNASGFQKAPS